MELTRVTELHARRQKLLAQRTATRLAGLWAQVDSSHLAASWRGLLPDAYAALATSQATAAAGAGVYIDDALEAQKFFAEAQGRVSPAAFAGVASDGRDLTDLLYQPVIQTLSALGKGQTLPRARALGLLHLDIITRTQVADAGRVAESVAIAARPGVSGYVRMLNLPSCSRCIILAGKWYRWNSGFKRHPRCDCRHIPAAENNSESLTTNPKKLFSSMDHAEQDRVFTAAGAQAMRDGADMNQIVNARRGALGLSPAGARLSKDEISQLTGGQQRGSIKQVDVFGQQVNVTTEGTTVRGLSGKRLGAADGEKSGRYRAAKTPRLMPESIYQAAGSDRQEAIRLLKRFGYIV
jgi:hypothetical protein